MINQYKLIQIQMNVSQSIGNNKLKFKSKQCKKKKSLIKDYKPQKYFSWLFLNVKLIVLLKNTSDQN